MNATSPGAEQIRKALELNRLAVGRVPVEDLPGGGPPLQGVAPGSGFDVPAPPRVVAVDHHRLRQRHILERADRGLAAQAFRALRTQVVQSMARSGYRSVAIVSPSSGDGRTITAINLAAGIAEDPDRTCLLVDLDLRRPCIADWFGAAVETDVAACLRGQASVAAALIRPEGFGKLLLLPAAHAVASSEVLLAAESTRRIVGEVHARYANRIVVYDLPPLLEAADALGFLPNVDAVLLVVREGKTRREDVLRCLDLLGDTPVVGTVLTAASDVRGF
jgi:Mrp family chromosome partitioning ATPase